MTPRTTFHSGPHFPSSRIYPSAHVPTYGHLATQAVRPFPRLVLLSFHRTLTTELTSTRLPPSMRRTCQSRATQAFSKTHRFEFLATTGELRSLHCCSAYLACSTSRSQDPTAAVLTCYRTTSALLREARWADCRFAAAKTDARFFVHSPRAIVATYLKHYRTPRRRR